jgi:phosphatidylserine/phosphatidylglycerophosphate/cardiolipin synthase-like enzyme
VKRAYQLQRILPILLLALVLVIVGCSEKQVTRQQTQPIKSVGSACSWSVYFSPNGGATDAIVDALDNAQKIILVQAYSFTSAPIARALVDAHRRGVDTKIILDDSNKTAKYSAADFLVRAGIPTWIDSGHSQ